LLFMCGLTMKAQDTIPPVINLNTPGTVYHKRHTPYNPVTPSVTDNFYPSNQVSLVLLSSDVDVNVTGLYTDKYMATDPSGNKTWKNRIVVIGDFSFVDEATRPAINIFPNPASSWLMIDVPEGTGTVGVQVISTDGKAVFENPRYETGAIIESSAFASGIYTVVVNSGQNVSTLRLVIKH